MNTDLSNSPFSVPEDFFDKVQTQALSSAKKVVRRRRLVAGSLCACLLTAVVIPAAFKQQSSEMERLAANYEYQQSLDSYEYDVFLDNMLFSE